MKKFLKFSVIVILGIIILFIVLNQTYFAYLRKAHSTFEDYFKFRGCVELIEKTDTYGICRLDSGKTIKIVKFENRWYLDGDLPYKIFGLTF